MTILEPIPDEPAAVADFGDELGLVIADYHAGIEAALRYEGIEIRSRAADRCERILELLDRIEADRVVFLGDLAHWIGEPAGAELEEITELLGAIGDRAAITLVKGNHDGAIEDAVAVEVSPTAGCRIGPVGFVHGHTWPAAEVLEAEVVCVGHEHPVVRIEDDVGGRRIDRVWIRGDLAADAFADRVDPAGIDGELVVVPAFNDLVSGTWINVEGQGYLSPFLPAGLADGQVYLLDGTRLGEPRRL